VAAVGVLAAADAVAVAAGVLVVAVVEADVLAEGGTRPLLRSFTHHADKKKTTHKCAVFFVRNCFRVAGQEMLANRSGR
jgi:hypothetical protein